MIKNSTLSEDFKSFLLLIGFSSGVPTYNLDEARNILSDAVVFLQEVIPVTSTSVKMIWKVYIDITCLKSFLIVKINIKIGIYFFLKKSYICN